MVVIIFVAAYLFREWVIKNTAHNPENEPMINAQQDNDNDQPLIQQQATANDILPVGRSVNTTDHLVLNEGEQTNARVEELRRELLRRRRLIENNNHEHNINREDDEFDNPYANNRILPGSTSHFQSNNNTRLRAHLHFDSDDENDEIITNPPSGTQSPFASWRDYQQDNNTSSLNHGNISHQHIASNSTGTWRAREFSPATDYFTEQLLNESLLEVEDDDEEINNPPVHPPSPPAPDIAPNDRDNNNEIPFDVVEDIDSILEAIGMRGNVVMMVQNSILMSLMINLCLCVAIWIPYVIGRSVILVKNTLLISYFFLLIIITDPPS